MSYIHTFVKVNHFLATTFQGFCLVRTNTQAFNFQMEVL